MKLLSIMGVQQLDTGSFYHRPLTWLHKMGLLKQRQDQITTIISCYAVDIHRATA